MESKDDNAQAKGHDVWYVVDILWFQCDIDYDLR